MIGILGAIGSILGIITAGLSIYKMLNPPSPPKIDIPKIDVQKIQESVSKIQPISDQARQSIQRALERYQRGELSPELRAKLDQLYNEMYERTISALQQRGTPSGSSIYQKALQQLNQWYQTQYLNTLGQDLRNALQLAGLANADINAIMSSINAQLGVGKAQMENWALGQMVESQYGQALANIIGNAGQSLNQFADWYSRWSQNQGGGISLPSDTFD